MKEETVWGILVVGVVLIILGFTANNYYSKKLRYENNYCQYEDKDYRGYHWQKCKE